MPTKYIIASKGDDAAFQKAKEHFKTVGKVEEPSGFSLVQRFTVEFDDDKEHSDVISALKSNDVDEKALDVEADKEFKI